MVNEEYNIESIRNPIFGMPDYSSSLIYINTPPSRLYSNIVNPIR